MSTEPKRVELTEPEREVDPYQMNDLFGYVDAMVRSHWPPDEIALTLLLLGYTPEDEVERIKAAARREALLAFADTRGVNVGDEDSEWWQGYRQAQRECLRDATDAALAVPTCPGALAEPERDEEGGR